MIQGSLGRIVLATLVGMIVAVAGIALAVHFNLSVIFTGLSGLAGILTGQVTMALIWRRRDREAAAAIRRAEANLAWLTEIKKGDLFLGCDGTDKV